MLHIDKNYNWAHLTKESYIYIYMNSTAWIKLNNTGKENGLIKWKKLWNKAQVIKNNSNPYNHMGWNGWSMNLIFVVNFIYINIHLLDFTCGYLDAGTCSCYQFHQLGKFEIRLYQISNIHLCDEFIFVFSISSIFSNCISVLSFII